ncbi:hypothetical protein SCHPADRAFT_902766 [Schizopora paradoxa]|uniref:UBC core domain-containing protein n=1 Tax=Schizopora paradoxa TaxID=27342 RepID=A0A0H2RTY1_9AGAM|nr:hypothetical protein SCHPADRAFT_902766 [Schizopora paradoxa]
MTLTTKLSQSKFYQEDIVQRVDDPSRSGVVVRCWHNSHEIPIPEHLQQQDPLLRPLKPDEVGVSFFSSQDREISHESEFKLIDRPFQTGDVCKRHVEDVQSGVVKSVDVRFKAAHVISNEKVEGWLSKDDIEDTDELVIGSIVIFDDWVGQVQNIFDEMVVELGSGGFVRVPEMTSRLTVGDRGADILPPPAPGQNHFMPGVTPSESDTVVAIKHSVIAVCWMAVNQKLTSEAAAGRQRPQRFWNENEQSKLTLVRDLDEKVVRVGHKISLRKAPFVTRHGEANSRKGQILVDTFNVIETQTSVTVLWQDGSTEVVDSKELLPHVNPDEYDCWPGDHVMWKNEDAKQPAIVQKVNAKQRTAELLLYDGKVELVPVLELDVHGSDAILETPHDSFGARVGDLVFIHADGSTNGFEKPMVPVIGELEAWAYEAPVQEETGEYSGWRKDLNVMGTSLAQDVPPRIDSFGKAKLNGDLSIHWFGEVLDLQLNGLIDVKLPNQQIVSVPLERLSRLNDGLDQLEDVWGDGFDDSLDDEMDEDDKAEILGFQTEDGEWHEYDPDDEGDWEDDEDEAASEADVKMDTDDDISAPNPDLKTQSPTSQEASSGSDDVGSRPTSSVSSEPTSVDESESKDEAEPCKRFDILPSAPVDHAFYTSTSVDPSRQFMSRLSKEYKALTTSLPDSIIVQTYEDRTDLLRCLIIGPENTPYEDAPFVIDWMLDSNFPQSPPIAHFHSWTNGNGRVNPNLYEEGKVCLSILGTWAGDRSESWSAARSSLLQAFVSIQGLVLVKEPWFCEPAYEKLRGTAGGRVNSRLYSEKAYVLSRGFVRRALEIPMGGLEEIINDIYYTKGRLQQVISKSNALIAKSREAEGKDLEDDDSDLAVPHLTAGGVLALSRTMTKLEQTHSAHQQTTK